MARVHIRCSRERCKLRYALDRHPDEYKRQWKCKGCGGTRFRIIKNILKESGHVDCTCNGYCWPSSTGKYECTTHRRGSRKCIYNRDGTLREYDGWTERIAAYSCPHDGIPRWPAIYCSEETRPGYSRWHFGWQATQAARSASGAAMGGSESDTCDVRASETLVEIDG